MNNNSFGFDIDSFNNDIPDLHNLNGSVNLNENAKLMCLGSAIFSEDKHH